MATVAASTLGISLNSLRPVAEKPKVVKFSDVQRMRK